VTARRLFDPRRRQYYARMVVNSDVIETIAINDSNSVHSQPLSTQIAPELPRVDEAYEALVLGLRDYVQKNGFNHVVIGLSGGIDSSLVAALATDALGPNRVVGISMPTRYSSDHSLDDAQQLAENLQIDYRVVPIDATFQSFLDMLTPQFDGKAPDTTEENIQARVRGIVLMGLSNKHGWLVLTTGNKSETGVGYSTLYGDTAGGFAVIKDVPKTLVYALCRLRNERAGYDIIPENVLLKPPSAELRPEQKDSDSLPDYDTLDAILGAYVEQNHSIDELVAMGYDAAEVERVIRLTDRSEYKRRQSPPGIKIMTRAFGKDWRLPITNAYRPTITKKESPSA
jgi:NAD+ synthase (glutamine-hydrolysing)